MGYTVTEATDLEKIKTLRSSSWETLVYVRPMSAYSFPVTSLRFLI